MPARANRARGRRPARGSARPRTARARRGARRRRCCPCGRGTTARSYRSRRPKASGCGCRRESPRPARRRDGGSGRATTPARCWPAARQRGRPRGSRGAHGWSVVSFQTSRSWYGGGACGVKSGLPRKPKRRAIRVEA
ncbi:MAG TPA: hypothetical protein DCX07_00575 [Phycisphaerales bacterium]|nr:hypothetical protein [Phycisphaerales bacterium]